jgi:uncharacterized protein with beta-barrel porin domain
VGGKGGSGATGGTVNLTSSSQIRTGGDWADGIVAQSIGGGGGVGGTATASGSLAKADTDIGVGGGGGAAGNGGTPTVTLSGSVSTGGYSAYGVLAQSIGGGGGQGGDGSDSSNATVTIGAGSGVGGSGGASGNGDAVKVQTPGSATATVSTTGDDAHGIVAQSIGGGGAGGAGSSSATGTVDLKVTVGGKGGSSGNGGTATVDGAFDVTTGGDRAFGIVAQSIGGGGGIGGTGSSEHILSITIGGSGGGSGNGDSVNVTLDSGSSITTSGKGAHAVIAQSIGGGGGIGGDASGGLLDFTPSGSLDNASSGDGGPVSVDVDATIRTTGESAFGILAQSLGGAGGFGGDQTGAFAGVTGDDGNSDTVTVTQAGSISATGENSIGIFAQSDAPYTPADIDVTVNGSVVGGTGEQGTGVLIYNGATNTLTVSSGGSISAGSGTAVVYAGTIPVPYATLAIVNDGHIDGNIVNPNPASSSTATALVAEGPNAIRLDNKGTVQGAELIEADVTNRGTLVVGKAGEADATRIAGDLVQQGTGQIQVDADLGGGSSDELAVDGDAILDGSLKIVPLSALPGGEARVLSVGGGLTGDLQAAHSAVFGYRLRRSGDDVRVAVTSADFRKPAEERSGNERQVADHVQSSWDAGGTAALGPLFAALGVRADASGDDYGEALGDLSLGVAAAPAARSQATMQAFADSLMSCPTFEDGTAMLGEGRCVWAQFSGGRADQDADDGASGFDQDHVAYQLGAQGEIATDWYLGVSAAYRRDWFDSDDGRSSSDGDTLLGGVMLKRELGPWLFGAGLSGGYGWYDTHRRIDIQGFEAKADSDPDLQNVGLRARAAYSFDFAQLYARPALDLDVVYTRQPGYNESGAGDLDLDVETSDQWGLVVTPSVELGGRIALPGTYVLRPYGRMGVSFGNQSGWTSSSSFDGAPDGAGTFDTDVPMDDIVARVAGGMQLDGENGLGVRLQYDGEFSANLTSHAGSLRVSWAF